jgi:hypothetical protein
MNHKKEELMDEWDWDFDNDGIDIDPKFIMGDDEDEVCPYCGNPFDGKRQHSTCGME